MMRLWQAAAVMAVGISPLRADEPAKKFIWEAPQVEVSAFSRDLGMLDTERDEYATNLAVLAGNGVAKEQASAASLADARRMLALALHLSPRNKRALVVNFQLSRGLLPEQAEGNYSAQVFARLMLTRGQLLDQQGGAENRKLARYLIQLAAEMDPKNEDAIYTSEVQRLDHGAPDWSEMILSPAKVPDAP